MDILSRTRRSLEWDRLKVFLANEANTPYAKEKCLLLEATNDKQNIAFLLTETQEAVTLLEAKQGFNIDLLADLREILARLKTGAALSTTELHQIRFLLLLSRRVRASLTLCDAQLFPCLSSYLKYLHSIEILKDAIDKIIDDEGNIRDDASPTLNALRHEIKRTDQTIKQELSKLIHLSVISKLLQEPIFTERNGRYVLPVNASSRGSVAGIVHDSSASGLTVYIEPIQIIELSNTLRLRQSEVEHEIERILREISAKVFSHHEELDSTFAALTQLDVIMAKAKLGLKYKGSLPEISNHISYKQARHPLLVLQDPAGIVVANDITLGGAERTLIITGPNTGGKTVLLKLIGLLSMMLKVGLLLPVAAGSKAMIFEEICADIGDEQSIEQSLSTFSSHMKNIVEILDKAGSSTLALLDEIGAGTDPKEGAALARSILEYLNNKETNTISTTHFSELKTLAYTEQGFINGSLDFNEESLSPTYKLRLGIPGNSKATTIAKRLGLAPNIVARANTLLADDEQTYESTVAKLERKLHDVSLKEELVNVSLNENRLLEEELKTRLAATEQDLERNQNIHLRQIEQEFKDAFDIIRTTIADLQKAPGLAKAQKAKEEMEGLKESLSWLKQKTSSSGRGLNQLAIGSEVKIRSLNKRAIVESLPEQMEDKNPIVVRVGNVRIKVPISDLEILPPSNKSADSSQIKSWPKHFTGEAPKNNLFVTTQANTLDLRGQRVVDALVNLERFLDESTLNGISPVMIIHGHGTGAIKSAVRQYLDEANYASTYRSGESFEGGDGVTIVEIS